MNTMNYQLLVAVAAASSAICATGSTSEFPKPQTTQL